MRAFVGCSPRLHRFNVCPFGFVGVVRGLHPTNFYFMPILLNGYLADNLEKMRRFYFVYTKSETVSRKFKLIWSHYIFFMMIFKKVQQLVGEMNLNSNMHSEQGQSPVGVDCYHTILNPIFKIKSWLFFMPNIGAMAIAPYGIFNE